MEYPIDKILGYNPLTDEIRKVFESTLLLMRSEENLLKYQR
jgi:hypothetical protein